MTILSDIIDDPTTNQHVRAFLAHTIAPAHNDNAMLFATVGGKRVRCVTATKAGRVGITENIANAHSPEGYVRLSDISQPLPTLYPTKPPTRRMRNAADVAPWVAHIASVTIDDIQSISRAQILVTARTVIVGMMSAINRRLTTGDIAAAIGRHPSTVGHIQNDLGFLGGLVSEDDTNYLRAVWRMGPLPLGCDPGEVPEAVCRRLAGRVFYDGYVVEAAPIRTLLNLVRADVQDEDEEIAEDLLAIEGELQCAA